MRILEVARDIKGNGDKKEFIGGQTDDIKRSIISEAIEFENSKFPPVAPWIVPAKPLQTIGANDSTFQSQIRESIERFDINNLAHRPAIQSLLSQLNCRDFPENRDFIWQKSVITDEQILQKSAQIVNRLKENYPFLAELHDFSADEIHAEKLNYSLIKILARTANQEPMLEIELHHSHFKYAPVLAATNEQLTLEKIEFISQSKKDGHKSGKRLFAQERRSPLIEEQQKLLLPEAHKLINLMGLGLGNGDTHSCNFVMKNLLNKDQASIRAVEGSKNFLQKVTSSLMAFFASKK
jgi:hypothetical protein